VTVEETKEVQESEQQEAGWANRAEKGESVRQVKVKQGENRKGV